MVCLSILSCVLEHVLVTERLMVCGHFLVLEHVLVLLVLQHVFLCSSMLWCVNLCGGGWAVL